MRVRLLDCWSREHFEEIGDIEDIACIIFVEVSNDQTLEVSNDQTLEVYYKDGDSAHFDSSSDRFRSLDVELEVVYLPSAGIDKRPEGCGDIWDFAGYMAGIWYIEQLSDDDDEAEDDEE